MATPLPLPIEPTIEGARLALWPLLALIRDLLRLLRLAVRLLVRPGNQPRKPGSTRATR